MDEMKMKLTSKFMRGLVSKLLSNFVSTKLGYKIDIHFEELDINVIDGETDISANIKAHVDSPEFIKLVKAIDNPTSRE